MNVLPGDVNRNAAVNNLDLGQVRARQLTSTTSPGTPPNTYTAFHDVNGNGSINNLDLGQVRGRQLSALPQGVPMGREDGERSSITGELFGSEIILP